MIVAGLKDFRQFGIFSNIVCKKIIPPGNKFKNQLGLHIVDDNRKGQNLFFHFQIIKVNENPNKFEVTLDVPQYKPEELKVTVINNTLSIEGKHADEKQENDADSACSSSVMRQFSRKWTLPSDCDPDKVVSNLSSDGILMVTAPKSGALEDKTGQKSIKN